MDLKLEIKTSMNSASAGHPVPWPTRRRNNRPPAENVSSVPTLVVIPTYNEATNIRLVCSKVLALGNHVHVLVVDDNSPDGTGRHAEYLSGLTDRLFVLIRRGPRGLGAAYMAGFRWGLRRNYQRFVQMDADLSHDPVDIPRLLRALEGCDLAIGSRYRVGGRTENWPLRRKLLSRCANLYAHLALRSKVRDLTGGFKGWRRETLESIDFAQLRCNGYGFQVEMNILAENGGFRIREIPITFRERNEGHSKMSSPIARQAFYRVGRLARYRWLTGHQHPALTRTARLRSVEGPEKILALCLGGIGDTVMSFAMLRDLRRRFPDAHITALAMWPQSADLLNDLGGFDCVEHFTFQSQPAWKSLLKALQHWRERYDLSVLAYPANRREFNLLAWLIHAKVRIGHRYVASSDLANLRWLHTHHVRQEPGRHNIEENLALMRLLPGEKGINCSRSMAEIRLGPIRTSYHDYARARLSVLPGPYVGIHAGSSTFKNMHGKRWPAQCFAELGERLFNELGLLPLLFGGAEDREVNRAIVADCPLAVLMETPSIRHTAALMQECSLFVSNDSSLAHLAEALDVPAIVICGPTDPAEVGAYTRIGQTVTANLSCSPCYRVSRKPLRCTNARKWACMKSVTVSGVVQIAHELLSTPKRDQAIPCERKVSHVSH